jgi:transposase-like protein
MSENVRKNGRSATVLASGETVAAAARKAGVTERTVYRWRLEDAFRRDVDQARAEMFSRALGCMAEGAASAALVLRQLCLKAKSETVKLGAARALLEQGPKLRESVELEERLRALEERTAADAERSDARRGSW